MQCPTCETTTVNAFCRECGKGVCRQCVREIDGVPHCADCAEKMAAAVGAPAGRRTFEAESVEMPSDEAPQRKSAASIAAAAASDEEPSEESTEPPSAGRSEPPPSGDAREAARRASPPRPRQSDLPPDLPNPLLAGILGFVPGLGAVYNGQYVKGVVHACLFGLLMSIATRGGAEAFFIPVIVLFLLYMPIEAVRTAQAVRRGEPVDEMSGLVGALFGGRERSPAAGIALIALGALLLLFTIGVLDFGDMLPYWPTLLIALGVYKLYRGVTAEARELEEKSERLERDARTSESRGLDLGGSASS